LVLWQEACAEGEDGLRRVLELLVRGILEQEMTALLGAEPCQRAEGRQGDPNGHKPRQVVTRSGALELLQPITQSPTVEAAPGRLREAVEALRVKYPRLAELLEEQGEDMLTVYQLPPAHRQLVCSTNRSGHGERRGGRPHMLERYQQGPRRRTRAVRIFPHEGSCLRLVPARAMETSEEWLVRRYPRMEAEDVIPGPARLAAAAG
jgi:transposase-like protein